MHDPELEAFYAVIAGSYDADYAGLLGGADIAFYTQLAEESGGPAFEMGCGTGRVLLPIARKGVAVFGMDGSPAMLQRLSHSLAAEPAEVRERVTVLTGDIRTASAGRRFPLVFAAANVLHSFLEHRDQLAWLLNARRHLEPGGAFCFDVFQFDYRRLAAEAGWETDVDRRDATGVRSRRFVRCDHEPEFQRFRVGMRWLTEDAAGNTLEERSGSVMQRWFTRGEVQLLLEMAGFLITDYWGNFARQPFGPGATHQIVRAVARE